MPTRLLFIPLSIKLVTACDMILPDCYCGTSDSLVMISAALSDVGLENYFLFSMLGLTNDQRRMTRKIWRNLVSCGSHAVD